MASHEKQFGSPEEKAMKLSPEKQRKLVHTPKSACTDDTTASNYGDVDSPLHAYRQRVELHSNTADASPTPSKHSAATRVCPPVFTSDSTKAQAGSSKYYESSMTDWQQFSATRAARQLQSPANIPLPKSSTGEQRVSTLAQLLEDVASPSNEVPATSASAGVEPRLPPTPELDQPDPEVEAYKAWLKQRLDNRASTRIISAWRGAPITPAVIKDAHASQSSILSTIHGISGLEVIGRHLPKALSRVQEKSQRDLGFAVLNDMMACRVLVLGHERVDSTIDRALGKLALGLKQKGYLIMDMHPLDGLRYDGSHPLNDIVVFLQVYVPSVGHLMEIQILHPFAAVQLSRNALIERCDSKREMGYVDLWDNWFYENVKDMLLRWDVRYVRYPWEKELKELVKASMDKCPPIDEAVEEANEQLIDAVWDALCDHDELVRRMGDWKAFI